MFPVERRARSRSTSADLRTAILLETDYGRTGSPHYAKLLDDADVKTAILPGTETQVVKFRA